jgi:hypothetical protein
LSDTSYTPRRAKRPIESQNATTDELLAPRFNRKAYARDVKESDLSGPAKIVAASIAKATNERTGQLSESLAAIGKRARYSARHVRRIVTEELEPKGWVGVERRFGTTSHYCPTWPESVLVDQGFSWVDDAATAAKSEVTTAARTAAKSEDIPIKEHLINRSDPLTAGSEQTDVTDEERMVVSTGVSGTDIKKRVGLGADAPADVLTDPGHVNQGSARADLRPALADESATSTKNEHGGRAVFAAVVEKEKIAMEDPFGSCSECGFWKIGFLNDGSDACSCLDAAIPDVFPEAWVGELSRAADSIEAALDAELARGTL